MPEYHAEQELRSYSQPGDLAGRGGQHHKIVTEEEQIHLIRGDAWPIQKENDSLGALKNFCCTFSAPKRVVIGRQQGTFSASAGMLYWGLMVMIGIVYIFIYAIVYRSKHLKYDAPIGTVRIALARPTEINPATGRVCLSRGPPACDNNFTDIRDLSYCSRSSKKYPNLTTSYNSFKTRKHDCRIWDEDSVVARNLGADVTIATHYREWEQTRVCDGSGHDTVCKKTFKTKLKNRGYIADVENFGITIHHSMRTPVIVQEVGMRSRGNGIKVCKNPVQPTHFHNEATKVRERCSQDKGNINDSQGSNGHGAGGGGGSYGGGGGSHGGGGSSYGGEGDDNNYGTGNGNYGNNNDGNYGTGNGGNGNNNNYGKGGPEPCETEAGGCPVSKCQEPPSGCQMKRKLEKTLNGCCPKLCYYECDDGTTSDNGNDNYGNNNDNYAAGSTNYGKGNGNYGNNNDDNYATGSDNNNYGHNSNDYAAGNNDGTGTNNYVEGSDNNQGDDYYSRLRRLRAQASEPKRRSECMHVMPDPTLNPVKDGADTFKLGTLLKVAGIDLDKPSAAQSCETTRRLQGTTLVLTVHYDNIVPFESWYKAFFNQLEMRYHYTLDELSHDEYKLRDSFYGAGWNSGSRTVVEVHGIRLMVLFTGKLGCWSWSQLLVLFSVSVTTLMMSESLVVNYIRRWPFAWSSGQIGQKHLSESFYDYSRDISTDWADDYERALHKARQAPGTCIMD
jgi:uncharacterized membrane protein YgcG